MNKDLAATEQEKTEKNSSSHPPINSSVEPAAETWDLYIEPQSSLYDLNHLLHADKIS